MNWNLFVLIWILLALLVFTHASSIIVSIPDAKSLETFLDIENDENDDNDAIDENDDQMPHMTEARYTKSSTSTVTTDSVQDDPKRTFVKPLCPDPNIEAPYGYVYLSNRHWLTPPFTDPNRKKVTRAFDSICPVETTGTPVDALDMTKIGSILPRFDYNETQSI